MFRAAKVRLEDLDIKPYLITKLKMAGIQSVFDLAVSIPPQLVDVGDGMLAGTLSRQKIRLDIACSAS